MKERSSKIVLNLSTMHQFCPLLRGFIIHAITYIIENNLIKSSRKKTYFWRKWVNNYVNPPQDLRFVYLKRKVIFLYIIRRWGSENKLVKNSSDSKNKTRQILHVYIVERRTTAKFVEKSVFKRRKHLNCWKHSPL